MFHSLVALDGATSAWIATHLAYAPLQWLLAACTVVGYGGWVWFGIAIVGWFAAPRLTAAGGRRARPLDVSRLRAGIWRASVAIALALSLTEFAAKPLARRDRPFVHGPPSSAIVWRPTTTSFPSGHAASSGAGALALARAWPPAAVPLALLAGVIGLSRVALGVHYVSDVVGGLLLGLFVGALAAPPSIRSTRPESRPGT